MNRMDLLVVCQGLCTSCGGFNPNESGGIDCVHGESSTCPVIGASAQCLNNNVPEEDFVGITYLNLVQGREKYLESLVEPQPVKRKRTTTSEGV